MLIVAAKWYDDLLITGLIIYGGLFNIKGLQYLLLYGFLRGKSSVAIDRWRRRCE